MLVSCLKYKLSTGCTASYTMFYIVVVRLFTYLPNSNGQYLPIIFYRVAIIIYSKILENSVLRESIHISRKCFMISKNRINVIVQHAPRFDTCSSSLISNQMKSLMRVIHFPSQRRHRCRKRLLLMQHCIACKSRN